ncbi:VWA domain-containing protein, partial [Streptomyces xiangluensis]
PVIETAPEPEPAAAEAEPEPVVEPEPEPVAPEPEPVVAEAAPEPEPETEPAPAAEATQTPAAEAEPEPEPAAAKATPEAEPEAEAKPAPEPVAAEVEAEAKPAAEATPAPEPVAAEATAEAESKPEPVAAEATPAPASAPEAGPVVAETTPESAPAPEAVVADVSPESEPAATAAEVAPDAEPTPAAAQADEPAAEAVPADLLTAYKSAGATLKKLNLTGTTAKVYLVLDRSASMRPYYKDGSAQALGEQALALAAHLDPEAKVHVVFFSTELDGTGELTVTDHENKIDDLHAGLGRMGRTSYHAAVEEVVGHYEKSGAKDPALVIFQTDGAPDARTPATQSLTDAAKKHPAVFFSFVAFGDPENKAFDYLRKLKTDNTAHFLAGETPRELTDQELYEGVLANWRP